MFRWILVFVPRPGYSMYCMYAKVHYKKAFIGLVISYGVKEMTYCWKEEVRKGTEHSFWVLLLILHFYLYFWFSFTTSKDCEVRFEYFHYFLWEKKIKTLNLGSFYYLELGIYFTQEMVKNYIHWCRIPLCILWICFSTLVNKECDLGLWQGRI